MKKYNRCNFSKEIVAIAYSNEELNQLEKEWIISLNAVHSADYYNQIDGGDQIDALKKKNSIPVICITNGKTFKSLEDAAIWSGYNAETVKRSFTKKHTYNYKKERYIFRPIAIKKIGCNLCLICCTTFKGKSNRQKICYECRRKYDKNSLSVCVVCGLEYIISSKNKNRCSNCKPKKKQIKSPLSRKISKKLKKVER